ncbi:MAG: hypothetical protein JNK81_16985 [Anaerolineales bacterium]|nr:hypothetical protein [Anaerolineales bacterium]
MMEEPKDDPAKKMRKLIGSNSPLTRLPKKSEPINNATSIEPTSKSDASPPKKVLTPINRPTQIQNQKPASTSTVKPVSPAGASVKPANESSIFGPRFWTIASVISLTINGITLLALLITAFILLRNGLGISSLLNMGNSLLGGLYTNFEKMDRASIQTNVEVNTTIPVKFDLQLNQQTNVVLSQDVTITNALVTVNTGGLNISRANTTIVLPQGTTLPVVLNLVVPVDTTVPVTLNVPVDIPLSQTQLHEPFTGLQDVVRPFYCMINSNAVNLNGEPICR